MARYCVDYRDYPSEFRRVLLRIGCDGVDCGCLDTAGVATSGLNVLRISSPKTDCHGFMFGGEERPTW